MHFFKGSPKSECIVIEVPNADTHIIQDIMENGEEMKGGMIGKNVEDMEEVISENMEGDGEGIIDESAVEMPEEPRRSKQTHQVRVQDDDDDRYSCSSYN